MIGIINFQVDVYKPRCDTGLGAIPLIAHGGVIETPLISNELFPRVEPFLVKSTRKTLVLRLFQGAV